MEFGEINETVFYNYYIIMAAFATLVYALYVAISIHKMNKN